MNSLMIRVVLVLLLIIQFSVSVCPEGDTFCRKCSGNICHICQNSYWDGQACKLVAKQSSDSNSISQCLTFENNQKHCKTCNYWYYVDKLKECQRNSIEGCVIEDPKLNKCIVCNSAILPNKEGKCEDGPKCSLDKCLLCKYKDGKEVCERCANNFTIMPLTDGGTVCVAQNGKTMNCLITHFEDPTKCLTCDINYYNHLHECRKNNFMDPINIDGTSWIDVIRVDLLTSIVFLGLYLF